MQYIPYHFNLLLCALFIWNRFFVARFFYFINFYSLPQFSSLLVILLVLVYLLSENQCLLQQRTSVIITCRNCSGESMSSENVEGRFTLQLFKWYEDCKIYPILKDVYYNIVENVKKAAAYVLRRKPGMNTSC